MRKHLHHATHALIKSLIKNEDIVVDMTCGHGFDTEFMAQFASRVYTFDIQAHALQSTQLRLAHISNIEYIHDSFEHVSNYVNNASLYVFNLGYLPKGDKHITTLSTTTVNTLKQLLETLSIHQHIVLTMYPGHLEGKKEYDDIMAFLNAQTRCRYISFQIHPIQEKNPETIWIYQ
jgi:hypothetical protein